MRRNLFCGLGLAVLAGLVAFFSGPLALQSTWPLLLGAAVALVPTQQLSGRLGAYGAGLLAAWIGFALRAGALPDIRAGRAIAALLPILIVTAVAAGTAGRLPLWAGLVGLAAFIGGYEAIYLASPSAFVSESVEALTSVVLASAIGVLAGTLLSPVAPTRHPVDAPASTADLTTGEQGV